VTRDAEQEAFFRAHYPSLAGWAAGLVGDADAGRDLASEAFVRLLGRWPKVAEPRAFLYVTTANLVRDRWRRTGSRRRAMDLLHTTAATSVDAHDSSLRDLIDRLPERTRVPVLLHYYADISAEDIASTLGRPAGTVRRLLAEGRAALRAALEEARL
jgi:RNA polymerase sigma-70 factor (ECF subfamily)